MCAWETEDTAAVRKTVRERVVVVSLEQDLSLASIPQVIQRSQGYRRAGKGAFGVPTMGALKLDCDRGSVEFLGQVESVIHEMCGHRDQERDRPQSHQ